MPYKAKIITDKNKQDLSNNYCLISYEKFDLNNINDKPIVKLICGHSFYYDNILQSYKITNRSGSNYIGKRICPYCRKDGGFLPKIDNNFIKGIHLNTKIVKKIHYCSGILKTGRNKDKKCKCKANDEFFKTITIDKGPKIEWKKIYYCGRHKHLCNV